MNNNIPVRRLTLRQILTHTDKCARDLHDHIQTTLLNNLSDFRDLSRPVRRRSHYPRMISVHNALKKVVEGHDEVQALVEQLLELLQEIRDHAKRDQVNRR
jgi:hypothetical protein